MKIIPLESVGALRFFSSKEDCLAEHGEVFVRRDYGDGRERWDYEWGLSLLFQEGAGLVAVTMDTAPPILLGETDLFELSLDAFCEWLRSYPVTQTKQLNYWSDTIISVPEWGLVASFAEWWPTMVSVEVFVGDPNQVHQTRDSYEIERERALVELLYAAFAEASRPTLDDITPHRCYECDEVRDGLAPYAARTVPDEEVRADSLPLLSPTALRHYLPRYIEFGFTHRDSILSEFLIYNLCAENLEERRYAAFSIAERQALHRYLKHRYDTTDQSNDFTCGFLLRGIAYWSE